MELSVKRSSLVLFLLLILLSPSTLSARIVTQQRATRPTATAPAAAPATRLPEAKIFSQVLPNGLEVIILEDHSIPLVTIELAVKNGSYTEPPELNGLSHLYEHMFFKQNRARGSGRLLLHHDESEHSHRDAVYERRGALPVV